CTGAIGGVAPAHGGLSFADETEQRLRLLKSFQ
ncbi:MAG: hypothetical protein ACI9UA_000383, partial [Pseudoalteromonas tetraodonis]